MPGLRRRKILRNNGFVIVVISSQPYKMFSIYVNDYGMVCILLSDFGLFVQETGSKPYYGCTGHNYNDNTVGNNITLKKHFCIIPYTFV